MTITTTPSEIGDEIIQLCQSITSACEPAFVPVQPVQDALLNDCFHNVKRQVEAHGGDIVYGWAVWCWPLVMVEAEFHAVWQDAQGEFIDVTPKQQGEKKILFLRDPDVTYEGRAPDNKRLPLREDPLIDDFIALTRLKNLTLEAGRRPGTLEVEMDISWVAKVEEVRAILVSLINRRGKRRTQCPCGSKKRYRDCHEKIVKDLLA